MMNYTDRLTVLMQDVVSRVPALSFIDMGDVLVFARAGRSNAEGAFATCHCLTLPASEPGYYFWRDRKTGRMTRRSEWFVVKSPVVTRDERLTKYMISFALPRFCDQNVRQTRKQHHYPGAEEWLAKLDTVVHEMYHIDPEHAGIRQISIDGRPDSTNCHGREFFERVARLVKTYLDTQPDPAVYDFLREDFAGLEKRFGGVTALTFRTYPSFPQRYVERAPVQPGCEADAEGAAVEPVKTTRRPTEYTERDLEIRQFRQTVPRTKRRARAA
jgi:hypothetical protein